MPSPLAERAHALVDVAAGAPAPASNGRSSDAVEQRLVAAMAARSTAGEFLGERAARPSAAVRAPSRG